MKTQLRGLLRLICCLLLLCLPTGPTAGIAQPRFPALADSRSPLLALRSTRPSAISNIRVTNVSDMGFSVSWITSATAAGSLNYGTTPALGNNQPDDPGAGPYAHHVTLDWPSSPNTLYYFDVVSDGETDDNGGLHYTVTTGSALGLPRNDLVYGQVFQADEVTPAAGAVVYITAVDRNGAGSSGRSASFSFLADSDGYWFVNLAGIRTTDYSAYFSYSPAGGDDLELQAEGGPPGIAGLTVDLGQSYAPDNRLPLPALVLCITCRALPPFSPSGIVTLDGAYVTAGTTVAAWCSGAQMRTTAAYVQAGVSRYPTLAVPGDDSATPVVREGCFVSETVTFKVGAVWATQAVPWISGATALTLTASSAARPAPVALALTIGRVGNAVQLSWPDDPANRSYEVWRSTAPYFTPAAAGAEILANALSDCSRVGGVITCQDAGAVGDPTTNYFYLVRAGNGTDAVSDSGWVGKFGFALQPGQ